MEFRRRSSSSIGITSPCRLGSTSSAIKTLTSNTPWMNDFTVEGIIGRGKFAVVKKCVEKSTGQHFAAKCIRKRRHNRDCTPDILHEIAVLEMGSKHQHLIGLHRVYETNSEFVLILEYAAGGEIFDHCVGVKDSFTEVMSRRLMSQILDAVRFLHDNDIVHLDLKPQNILLSCNGTDPEASIKLVDFGLSKFLADGLELREILGTPDYVAPEVLNFEPISTATDIWSLGVVAYVMLTGVSPFLGETKQETLMNVTTATLDFPSDLFNDLSPACRDFISNLLQREPSDRFSAKQSVEHPWITGHVAPLKILSEKNEDSEGHDEVFLNGHHASGRSSPSTVDDSTSTASSCSIASLDEIVQSVDGESKAKDPKTPSSPVEDIKNDVDYNGNIVDSAENSSAEDSPQSTTEESTTNSQSTVRSSIDDQTQPNITDGTKDTDVTNLQPSPHECITRLQHVESAIKSPTPSPKMGNLTLSSSMPTSPAKPIHPHPPEANYTNDDSTDSKGCSQSQSTNHSSVSTIFHLKVLNTPSDNSGGKNEATTQISEATSIVIATDPCLKRRKFDYCGSTEQSVTEISVAD